MLTSHPGCGQRLRQDDPSALKDIVTLAQSKQGDNLKYVACMVRSA